MPRFVILAHDHPAPHWDFMLEDGPVLLTWRLASPPLPKQTVASQRIGDHRPLYLDYEGPVSGGRGNVTRWDGGEFEWLERADDRIVVRLRGRRADGTFRLEQTAEHRWVGQLGD
jgi:hypothetical protein